MLRHDPYARGVGAMMMHQFAPLGTPTVIGDYHFSEDKITRFAKKFDPQYFHVDPERAKDSILGGLCASGWHVCSAWMQVNMSFINSEFSKLVEKGIAPPKLGPSMGFHALKWLKPVFANDTVTYSNTTVSQSEIANHPDRLLLEFHCEGVNQRGEKVLSFSPRVIEFK